MDNQIQTLKGFRDFLGADAQKRQWLVSKIRAVFERFGFEPIETPALEYESLLLGKYGEEADKLIFGFEDRGGRRVALKYDQTIPLARIVAQYRNLLVFPFKRYQIQSVWRSEKPQKGRYREFLQCDADIVGSTTPETDAEVLAAFYAIYKDAGMDKLKIRLNLRRNMIERICAAGIEENRCNTILQTIDKLDKKTEEEIVEELCCKELDEPTARKVLESVKNAPEPEDLKKIRQLAVRMGVPENALVFDPALARGLDYYTGMIFEGYIEGYDGGSVGGGGRYDKLLNDLVGVDMPAVGFAVGFDRTLEAAELLGKIPAGSSATRLLVTIFSPDLAIKSFELTRALREEGIPTEVYLDSGKKLDIQLKYASRKRIPFAAIVGPEEAATGQAVVKNMATGEQTKMPAGKVAEFISSRS